VDHLETFSRGTRAEVGCIDHRCAQTSHRSVVRSGCAECSPADD
jgi:hypothetical protein